jgi:leucyl aminopeptidase
MALPKGTYSIAGRLRAGDATVAALGWALGGYHFGRYRKTKGPRAVLVWPKDADRPAVERAAAATTIARDLINTPAADMGPAELAAAARQLARRHGAKIKVIVGEDLLRRRYPAIHAVGRASSRAPRLIDLTWGRAKAPLVTLVGKGVCFDSGGLDLKSASGMKLMKKDMGGAANVLGLAHMIMAAKLKLRLRVLIPAVENSVSGNAMRPLDVISTRQGLTVEIGNTDAEGRVILADALSEASTDKPQLLIDFATLTGAARVALGTDLPAFFCNNEQTAADLVRFGGAVSDPLWRLPLWAPYRSLIESSVADINNAPAGGYGGAITAALFLAEFVDPAIAWVHVDLMAWNLKSSPGRPEGGEAQGMRAMFELIQNVAGG